MRALRVVGLTEDGEVVLEDPVRLERYTVPADERLRAAARGDLSRLGQIAIELESQLRPREIQARIRAGASVEQVATAAGVPEQKIERFAYPVLLERLRTADNAQRAHPMRADGPDNRTLGDVVAHTFGLRGQSYDGVKWDSWKGEDGRWVVALSWRAGRSDNRAHWVFQPGAHGGTVTALDEHASDLIEGLPARPLRTVGAVVDMTRPEEEPPPAPSPVEQWRAAASDSYREQRLPTSPDSGRRTPSEPWRPAPPQRQPEPPAAREPYRPAEPPAAYRPDPLADPRPAGRPDAYRDADPLADPRPARPGSYPRTERPTGYRPTDARPPAPQPDTGPPRRGGPATTEWAPWERGVTRTAPAAPGGDVSVPAARNGSPEVPSVPESAEDATPPVAAPRMPVEAPVAAEVEAPSAAPETDAGPSGAELSETVVTEPATEPSGHEPSRGELSETVRAGSSGTEPSGVELSKTVPDESSGTEPSGAASSETVPSEPSATESSAAEPSTTEPSAAHETTAASTTPDAAPVESDAAEPATPETPTEPKTPAKRSRKGKPVMPSWDEVLLGVRGPR